MENNPIYYNSTDVELCGVPCRIFEGDLNQFWIDSIKHDTSYAPFYPTPRVVLEESIDMKKWNKVNLSDDLPKEYRWPEEIKIDLHMSGVRHKFFRVKIQDR